MKFGYEDLDVWNKAVDFAVQVIDLRIRKKVRDFLVKICDNSLV